MTDLIISAAQSRAARAWLNISIDELAERAGVGRRAVADFERGARTPYDRTLVAMRTTLEGAGVTFVFRDGDPIGILFEKDSVRSRR